MEERHLSFLVSGSTTKILWETDFLLSWFSLVMFSGLYDVSHEHVIIRQQGPVGAIGLVARDSKPRGWGFESLTGLHFILFIARRRVEKNMFMYTLV
jgi:hypothetical protein